MADTGITLGIWNISERPEWLEGEPTSPEHMLECAIEAACGDGETSSIYPGSSVGPEDAWDCERAAANWLGYEPGVVTVYDVGNGEAITYEGRQDADGEFELTITARQPDAIEVDAPDGEDIERCAQYDERQFAAVLCAALRFRPVGEWARLRAISEMITPLYDDIASAERYCEADD